MAENQTASEDSGQQQKQHQDQQQQQQQNNQQQDSSPDQESSSDSITPNPRSKPVVMKNSLRSMKVPRTISGTSAEAANHHSQGSSGKHQHHTNHHHHIHNNTSSGHHGHNVIHRTTSESLRLGSEYTSGSGSLTNSTSNSSMHGGGSSSLAGSTTTMNNSNSTTSNHSHSMSSSSSPHSHSSHPHSHQHISNSGGGPLPRKPKTSSFQITSVTVGNKLSSDNGDDSADDLDESHTDDNSRITDLETETPSVSEDTFSKEDVFFANNALSTTAPVIPTSAQYGLVVVDPIGPSVGQTIQNVQVNVADNIINVVSAVGNKKKPEVKETQHRSERFKVVKIESTEPFRRGRWMCMDYLDHSGNKDINAEKNISGSGVQSVSSVSTTSGVTGDDASRGATQTAIILTNDTSAGIANSAGGGGGVENHIDAAAKLAADSINVYRSESQNSAGTGQNANQTIVHAQTLGGPLNLQQQQQSQLPNQFQGQHFEGGHGQTLPIKSEFQQQQQQPAQHQQQVNGNEPSVAGQSQPASFFVNQLNATAGSVAAGNGTATNFQQQQSTPAHGVTLPANIHMQNGGSGGNGATTFQPVSYIPTSEMGVSPGASIQQQQQQPQQTNQQQQSSRVYVSQASTSAAPQSYPNAANIMTGGAGSSSATTATYTNAPTTQQLADSINTVQGTQQQQSDSNAATPSNGGQSQPQAQPQPQQQFQSMHPNPLAGQTMPILSQMSYDIQAQQSQQSQPTQSAQTGTPATVSDPTALAATIQQQQQQPIDNNVASSSSTGAESSPNVSSGAGGGGGSGGGSGTATSSSSISQQAPSSSSSLSVAGSVQASKTGGSAAGTSTTGSSDDHQLHHNPETETERGASRLSHALAHRRKTISAIPQLPTLAPIFDFNEPTDPLADITDEDAAGTQNIFTNLALGDDRFKLPVRYSSDEGMDSLAGSCPVTRSMPIPISGAGAFGRQMSYNVMSRSASPTSRANPYSPFYYGSPTSAEALSQSMSISYDPSYAYPSNRLSVPISMTRGVHRNMDVCGWGLGGGGGGGGGDGVGIDDGRGGNRSSPSTTAAVLADGAVAAVSALNSASGTSAVAIDNKIEQAMDLVKSHLMIAVREEVEVLKEKISELMDKINQLEVENTILKANMPQETLHQLQLQTQLQITGSGASNIIAQQQTPQQQQQQQQAQPQQAQQQSATQQSQQPSQQQQNQQQQQPTPQAANPANTTTNGPMS